MQLFLVVILAMAVNASWQFGTDGQFIYNQDCDFTDPAFQTFSIQQSARENCGKNLQRQPGLQIFRCRGQTVHLEGRARKSVQKWQYLRPRY